MNYLDTISSGQRSLFNQAIHALDVNFASPLLVSVLFVTLELTIDFVFGFKFDSPRYSAWYAVGLLARNEGDDVEVASELIRKAWVIICLSNSTTTTTVVYSS